MKYLLLIALFTSFSLSLNSTEKGNDNETIIAFSLSTSLAEQYYDRLEVNTNMPSMLNKFLDRKALERLEVPPSLWFEIKNSIDYVYFKTQVVEIIPNYYSDSELQTIIETHAERPYVPITKLSFRKQLSLLGQDFIEDNFMVTVNAILSDNGYNPL